MTARRPNDAAVAVIAGRVHEKRYGETYPRRRGALAEGVSAPLVERQEGVAIAREMVRRVRPMAQGVQLSAPFGKYQLAVEVAEAIGPR